MAFYHGISFRVTAGISGRQLVVMAVVMMAAVLFFALYTWASTVLVRDQWHYLTIVAQYYEKGFDLSLLGLKHGEHVLIAYNAWFLLNGIFFGLDTRLELFLGFSFLCGYIWLLYREFDSSLAPFATPPLRHLLFVPLLLTGLSFSQLESYSYGLLSFCVFGELWLMMAFIRQLDGSLRRASPKGLLLLMLMFTLLAVGFAGGGWLVHLGAGVVVWITWLGITRRRGYRCAPWWVLGSLLLSAGLVVWVNSLIVDRSPNPGSSLGYLFQHADQAMEYVLILLANSVIYVNALSRLGMGDLVPWIGMAVLVVHAIAIYLYFRYRMWERTILPLYLLVYFWLVAVALLLYRLPVFGTISAASPRYVSTLQVGTLGVLWILAYAALCSAPRYPWRNLQWVLGITVLCLYVGHFAGAVYFSGFLRERSEGAIQTVQYGRFDSPSVTCPNTALCRDGEAVLKEYRLNIYGAR